MKESLRVLREIRLTAFELVIIPALAVTTIVFLTNKKAAKKIRRNINIVKGDQYYDL